MRGMRSRYMDDGTDLYALHVRAANLSGLRSIDAIDRRVSDVGVGGCQGSARNLVATL